ncbi:pheromone-regulated protein prm10 [Coemansia sp. RSA 552]|nr:pheromone-regulated protein prm10 [Coemansia sp. RSA 552]
MSNSHNSAPPDDGQQRADAARRSLAQRRIWPYDGNGSSGLPHQTPPLNHSHISARTQYHPLPSNLARSHRRLPGHSTSREESPEEQHQGSSEAKEKSAPARQGQQPSSMFDSPPLDPATVATVVPEPDSSHSGEDEDHGLYIHSISRGMGETKASQPANSNASADKSTAHADPPRPGTASGASSPPKGTPTGSGSATSLRTLEDGAHPEMAQSNFDASRIATLGEDGGGSISIRVDNRKRARNLLRRMEGRAAPSGNSVLGNLIRLHSVVTGSDQRRVRNPRHGERGEGKVKPKATGLRENKSWASLSSLARTFRPPKKPAPPEPSRAVPRSGSVELPRSMSSARVSAMMMMPEAFARNGVIPPPSTHSSLRLNEKYATGYFSPRSNVGSPAGTPPSLSNNASTVFPDGDDERAELINRIAEILEKQDFLMHLARAWHRFGSPVHRMEANLLEVSKYLGIDACFFTVPGLTLMSFGDPDVHSSETHIVRASDGYDMYRLEKVNRISRRLRKGKATVHAAIRDIETLMAAPPIYPWYLRLAVCFVQSFFVSTTLFHGAWREAALAGGLGVVVGAFEMLGSRSLTMGYILNVLPPMLVAVVSALLSDHICFSAVPMAAYINLLPGLGLALAMTELSSSNVICGAVRLVSALMTSFMIGWSTIVGNDLGMAMLGKEPTEASISGDCQGISMLWWILSVPLSTIGFGVWFKVHWKQWPGIIFAAAAGLVIQTFCNRVKVMTTISAGIASFAVGMFSNVYGHLTHSATNANIVFLGIIQLVPGSTGVKSFISYLSAESSASTLTMNMLSSSISIAVGLLLSNGALYSELKRFRLGSF